MLNSALAFACAELVTAALHETGHGLTAQALGFSPRIYAFFEDNPTGSPLQSLGILAAGPLASLVIGLAFLWWYQRGRPGYSFGRLLLCWLAWVGIMQFVNYVIVTPWLHAGDTAQIADLLALPVWARYGVALVGFGMLYALARPAAVTMFAVAPRVFELDSAGSRRRYIALGFYLPVVIGMLLMAPATIGGRSTIIFLGLLGTFGNIDLPGVAMGACRQSPTIVSGPDAPLRLEPAAGILYLMLVAFYVLALAPGLPV